MPVIDPLPLSLTEAEEEPLELVEKDDDIDADAHRDALRVAVLVPVMHEDALRDCLVEALCVRDTAFERELAPLPVVHTEGLRDTVRVSDVVADELEHTERERVGDAQDDSDCVTDTDCVSDEDELDEGVTEGECDPDALMDGENDTVSVGVPLADTEGDRVTLGEPELDPDTDGVGELLPVVVADAHTLRDVDLHAVLLNVALCVTVRDSELHAEGLAVPHRDADKLADTVCEVLIVTVCVCEALFVLDKDPLPQNEAVRDARAVGRVAEPQGESVTLRVSDSVVDALALEDTVAQVLDDAVTAGEAELHAEPENDTRADTTVAEPQGLTLAQLLDDRERTPVTTVTVRATEADIKVVLVCGHAWRTRHASNANRSDNIVMEGEEEERGLRGG